MVGAVAALLLAMTASLASAQGNSFLRETDGITANRIPTELQGAKLNTKLGKQIPLDLEFKDSTGKRVTLGDYFQMLAAGMR